MSERAANKKETVTILEKTTNIKTLLEGANRSSERLAGLHIAFLAVCAYILVIVSGTTDLDLLRGKGVKLPVINVDVPIVGFYSFSPYLILLVHFNLLLQLQLLSRKLFAFDALVPQDDGIGGFRDQLSIFPYTYYLVGKPSPLVRTLLGLIVTITLFCLPLLTILILQLRFLAYQSEAITWMHRTAAWLDIAMITTLWPVILNPKDDWYGYWRDLTAAFLPRRTLWLPFVPLIIGFLFLFFGVSSYYIIIGFWLIMASTGLAILFRGWKNLSRFLKLYNAFFILGCIIIFAILDPRIKNLEYFDFGLGYLSFFLLSPLWMLWHPNSPRGSLAILSILLIGTLLPLAFHIKGEKFERYVLRIQGSPGLSAKFRSSSGLSTMFSLSFEDKRTLNLQEKVLTTSSTTPEIIATIRMGNWQKALNQIEPIDLKGRNFQYANMSNVILVGADLRETNFQNANLNLAQLQGSKLENAKFEGAKLNYAQLQGAYLRSAKLQGADLNEANLQGAELSLANLQGAFMSSANLKIANLAGANLQGAYLRSAKLQGAVMIYDKLQGANLSDCKLQGAFLRYANFQGTNLKGAQLQGAILDHAVLQGVNLEDAQLQFTSFNGATLYAININNKTKTDLIEAREIKWEPLNKSVLNQLTVDLDTIIKIKDLFPGNIERLKLASSPTTSKIHLTSCIAEKGTNLVCKKQYDPQDPKDLAYFKKQLHSELTNLACGSPEIYLGIIRQDGIYRKNFSSREGILDVLKNRQNDKNCKGPKEMDLDQIHQIEIRKVQIE